ncbi:MAG: penicillin-binding protein activator [Deltaproteobacteria bacterium]|nr:penicillin-binding protein activator [Deltaproteobacteria bacterium]
MSKLFISMVFPGLTDWKKAVPVLIVGMAFFISGCQAIVPVKKAVVKDAPAEQFALADEFRQRGELDRALEVYGAYVEKYPRHENVVLALDRMAGVYSKKWQFKKALKFYKRIAGKYPAYARLSAVQYQIARLLYLLKEYTHSVDESFKWLEKYHKDPLRGEVLVLLGDVFKALGNNVQAFNSWLKAKETWRGDLKIETELNNKLKELINVSGIEALEKMAQDASGSEYAPEIHYRMATFFLEQNDLERAKTAAMALVRSTQEQSWIDLGKQLLERMEEELSVRPGVVGCLLPLTGRFGIYGEEVLNGIQLGTGMFGEPGEGPDLELVIKDTKGKPEPALAGLEDLVHNEKVMAIIGPLSSRTAVAVAEKAQGLGIPIITLTQREGITETGDMVFRNFLTPSKEVKRLLDPGIFEMGIKRFAILYPDNSYGHFFVNLFWDRLEEMGGTVAAVESYDPDTTDFADQIKKMTGLYYPRPHPLVRKLIEMRTPEEEESRLYPEEPEPIIEFDAIFIPDNFQRIAMIAPQLVYHDVLDVLLMGTSLWQSPELIETAGDYVQGAIFPSGFFESSGESCVSVFSEDYLMDFDATPGILAATGYDTIRLLKHMMAGEGVRTRGDLKEALLECRDFPGLTGNVVFDPEGEVEKEPFLLTISGRRMVVYR